MFSVRQITSCVVVRLKESLSFQASKIVPYIIRNKGMAWNENPTAAAKKDIVLVWTSMNINLKRQNASDCHICQNMETKNYSSSNSQTKYHITIMSVIHQQFIEFMLDLFTWENSSRYQRKSLMIYKSATFTKTTIHLYYFLDSIKIQFGSDLKSLMKRYFRRYCNCCYLRCLYNLNPAYFSHHMCTFINADDKWFTNPFLMLFCRLCSTLERSTPWLQCPPISEFQNCSFLTTAF